MMQHWSKYEQFFLKKKKWPKLYSDNCGLIAGVYKEWQEETWK